MAECVTEKLSWCLKEQICQRVKCIGVERSCGLDTALYKNLIVSFIYQDITEALR